MDCNHINNQNRDPMSSAEEQSSEGRDKSNKWADNKTNENNCKSDSIQSVVKTDSKENSKYRKVESRYKQSTQEWIHKRADDSHSSQDGSGRPPSRNPSPLVKTRTKITSTPVSTDKSLNCSGISVINKVKENHKNNEFKPDLNIKKYGKALITGRKSIASKRLPFGCDADPNPNVGQTNRPIPLTVGLENQTKVKEMENSIIASTYFQTVFLNLKAKQMKNQRKENAFNKMSQIWFQTNELRTQLFETQKCVNILQNSVDSIEMTTKEKKSLEQYLTIRSKIDLQFNSLSKLIAEQKLLLKIENCSQKDFKKLSEFVERSPKPERMESFEELSNALVNIENSYNTLDKIKSIETEFKTLYQSFIECVKELQRFERIDNSINPKKYLSLKKLF